MQTHKNVNLAPESFRRSTVPRRLKHRARRRRRILCLLPVILVFGVLAAALLRFTPALAYADIFPAQAFNSAVRGFAVYKVRLAPRRSRRPFR